MQIILTEWYRNWHSPQPQPIKPCILPIGNERVLLGLITMLGNGEYDDLCFESESPEALEAVRGLLTGTGAAKRVQSHPIAISSRLCRPAYEVYMQGDHSVFFVNPRSRPELFSTSALERYSAEFGANS
jgi:hypothetical protein